MNEKVVKGIISNFNWASFYESNPLICNSIKNWFEENYMPFGENLKIFQKYVSFFQNSVFYMGQLQNFLLQDKNNSEIGVHKKMSKPKNQLNRKQNRRKMDDYGCRNMKTKRFDSTAVLAIQKTNLSELN